MYDDSDARPIRVGTKDVWFSNLGALEKRIQAEIAELEALEQRLERNPRDRAALEQIADRAEVLRELLDGQIAWIDELAAAHDAGIDDVRAHIRALREQP
jgi:uncharacterized protein involved in exopolysaccharide biosynthesis